MGQILTMVQTWLNESPGGSSSPPDAEEASKEALSNDTDRFTGFEEGLAKTDVLVETGLTPEEYICQGLESYGGRLRQQGICALTGWSEATVSRTLTEMEEAKLIARIRLGRENVVCLPDALPGQRSPSLDD